MDLIPAGRPSPSAPAQRILVHLGSGPLAQRTDWTDYDGSLNARVNWLPSWAASLVRSGYRLVSGGRVYNFPRHVRYLKIGRRIELPTNYADAIFASHVWEHLHYQEAIAATGECWRILKPGGVLRLVVPDLKSLCARYARTENAEELNASLLFCAPHAPRGVLRRLLLLGGDLHTHKYMYDEPALLRLVSGCGFVGASPKALHDSGVPEIAQVESPGRVLNGEGIIVECHKPLR